MLSETERMDPEAGKVPQWEKEQKGSFGGRRLGEGRKDLGVERNFTSTATVN